MDRQPFLDMQAYGLSGKNTLPDAVALTVTPDTCTNKRKHA